MSIKQDLTLGQLLCNGLDGLYKLDFSELRHQAEMYLKDPLFVPQDLREVFDKIYKGGEGSRDEFQRQKDKAYDLGYSAGYDSGLHDGEYCSGDDD